MDLSEASVVYTLSSRLARIRLCLEKKIESHVLMGILVLGHRVGAHVDMFHRCEFIYF